MNDLIFFEKINQEEHIMINNFKQTMILNFFFGSIFLIYPIFIFFCHPQFSLAHRVS